MADADAFYGLWELARTIRPLPFDITGRQLRQSFSREGAYASYSEPQKLPRKHPVPPGFVISLPAV